MKRPSCILTLVLTCVSGAGAAEPPQDATHWAFEPIRNPTPPEVTNVGWAKNPIDLFILARLERAGLQPAPPAAPRELQRRLYFDLIGMPPPPGASLVDLEGTIDLLLASPHYGERWGRHWLDVVRYADSNGLDENAAHANAWRYRDFVMRSLNADMPFDEFLVLQLAGDLLPAESHAQRVEHLVALGFLSLGPKVLAEPDKVKMEMDIIDEQIDTIGRAFLGLTLGCARCHDHKFDPIPTADYYALAGIFKSVKTMQSLKTVAKWHENSLATPEEQELEVTHTECIEAQKKVVAAYTEKANKELLLAQKLDKLPEKPEEAYPEATKQELEQLRATLKRFEATAPKFPTAMGVVESTVTDLPIFVRGDHSVRGELQPRRFPGVLVKGAPTPLSKASSGRLELARWIASAENSLAARVIVNRVWRWHFGRGLVSTPDNFGRLGSRPTHPDLLDWLASWFMDSGWSLKRLNRLILASATYAMGGDVLPDARVQDPINELYSRAPLRRLEAESLRDALLELGGLLDKRVGGHVWTFENYTLVFNHESKDATTYDSTRRAVYLPIIRNNVYALFELFDFPDPGTVGGDRRNTVTAPQALLLMNSPLVLRSTEAMAARLLREEPQDDARRVQRLYRLAYSREPRQDETAAALDFVRGFVAKRTADDLEKDKLSAWQALCQAVVSSNEFMYLR